MRLSLLLLFSSLLFSPLHAAETPDNGLIMLKSPHSVEQTLSRLETAVLSKKLNVFSQINHAKGAEKAGLTLAPNAVLLFGNPNLGTKLMQCNPQIGLDLPLKVLSWQDADKQVWLAYTHPAKLAERYQLGDCAAPVIKKMTGALNALSSEAVSTE